MMSFQAFENPFRPGAGHQPPYLAGRSAETAEFERRLEQSVVLTNLVLTGLRGVGKTVLLDTFKPIAFNAGWRWSGGELSESSSVSEDRVVLRLLTDLAVTTADLQIAERERTSIGFGAATTKTPVALNFETLKAIYESAPGLPSDKLKKVLDIVWTAIRVRSDKGIVFAYDEAQNLTDHAGKDQFPLSLLLDVFQSVQKKGAPFLLVLVGLPTLFPKLVEARTFAERMFRVVTLNRLSDQDSRDAILRPIDKAQCPVRLEEDAIQDIIVESGGYPYFIQFICREVYDAFVQGQRSVPLAEITQKLDSDFFAGRWARATDRQRDLLIIIAELEHSDGEFTVQEIAQRSKERRNPFSPSHINQMLVALAKAGLIYKNRHGKYSFAVPLLNRFIVRQVIRNDGPEEPGGQRKLF